MEVKPGFKRTEMGQIPEDWSLIPIGNVITDFRGGAPLKPSDFTSSGVKVLPKGGVGRTGWLQIEDYDLQYCSNDYAKAHRRNQVDETFTIVVLRDLVPSGPSIGLMVRIKGHENFILAQGVYGFHVKQTAVPSYLVQLSNTYWYRKLVNSIMVGSTQVHVTNTAFKRAQIPLPPPAEQEAIADVLSDADALIEALEQLLAKKLLLKKGAMRELLLPKKAWTKQKLGYLATLINGRAYSLSEWEAAGTPVIRLQNLTGRGEDFYFSNLPLPDKQYCQSGDLLFMWSATFGPIIWQGPRAIFHYHIWKIECHPKRLHKEYLYHLLSDITAKLKSGSSRGGTMLHLTKSGMEAMELAIPDYDEQEKIAAILSDMDAEISTLEAKLFKACQIKQGMMQELLTGKIRLV